MKFGYAVVSLFLALFAATAHAASESPFPNRASFKDVPVIEIEQLGQQFDGALIVDVRSRYEYETLHIKGAVHIPLSKDKLPAMARELRGATGKALVFYCNGTACKKSYEAARYAIQAGLDRVYVFDAGMDAWSNRYPERSVLLGHSPVLASELIGSGEFTKRLIDPREFEARLDQGAIVLDIRDLRQRDVALFPMREQRATLDDTARLAAVVAEARKARKTLLVYDKVGKQIRWFQYYLEQQGLTDYYFLAGGAEGFHEAKLGKLSFKAAN